MSADLKTPDVILREADLTIFGGQRTLVIEIERNVFGGQSIMRLLSKDPFNPRRKPTNLLRAAGVADVLLPNEGETAADMLDMLAEALRRAEALGVQGGER